MSARHAPGRRPTGWKPPRPKGEVFRAVLAGLAVVVLTAAVIAGLHRLDSSGSPPRATVPAPTPTVSTPPASTPPASAP